MASAAAWWSYFAAVYSDDDAAALYDLLNPWGPSDDFYLSHVMRARSVLDVGCGTGMLLHRAREEGQVGRLVGIDPDRASLDRARKRQDVEWVHGKAADLEWVDAFELAVMANNAFQCLVTDDEIHASLVAIRKAITGRFVFETRNPNYRQWEEWHPGNAIDVIDHHGTPVRVEHRVEDVSAGMVTFTETTFSGGKALRIDRARLRFLDEAELTRHLERAGLGIRAITGDWAGGPLTDASKSIIVVAEPVEPAAR